jgi:cell division septum initiation protein DivIVA
MITTPQPRRLTNAQALLLQLFDRDLPEAELTELRRVLASYLFEKATAEADRVLNETGQTADDIERDTEAINESRTAYRERLLASHL